MTGFLDKKVQVWNQALKAGLELINNVTGAAFVRELQEILDKGVSQGVDSGSLAESALCCSADFRKKRIASVRRGHRSNRTPGSFPGSKDRIGSNQFDFLATARCTDHPVCLSWLSNPNPSSTHHMRQVLMQYSRQSPTASFFWRLCSRTTLRSKKPSMCF